LILAGFLVLLIAAIERIAEGWASRASDQDVATAVSDVPDFNRLEANTAKVFAYCKKNRSRTVPTAIKKSAS